MAEQTGRYIVISYSYIFPYTVLSCFMEPKPRFISKQAWIDSHFYSLIAPFGPAVIRFITGFIPFGQIC